MKVYTVRVQKSAWHKYTSCTFSSERSAGNIAMILADRGWTVEIHEHEEE